MLIGVFKSLKQTESLIDRSTNGQIINGNLSHNSIGIYDEQSTECDAAILNENAVLFGHSFGQVRQNWKLNLAKTSLLARRISPSQM